MTEYVPLRRRPARGWVRGPAYLAAMGLALFTLVSGNLLVTAGIPYSVPGGDLPAKIHPGTDLVILAFLWLLFRQNPVTALHEAFLRQRAAVTYAATITVMLGYSVASWGPSGAAFLIDTLLAPGLLVIILDQTHPAARRRIFLFLLALLVLDAVIGLGETALHARLIPYMRGNRLMTEDYFRATALGGHPLSNALRIVVVSVAVMSMPGLRGKRSLLLLFLLALLAFGSRTALILFFLLGAVRSARNIIRKPREGLASLVRKLPVLAAGLGITAILAARSGLGERIFASLQWDSSAAARFLVLRIPSLLSRSEWWTGMKPQKIEMILYYMKRTSTLTDIENIWILFLMQFGLPLTVLFTLALAWFIASLRRKGVFDNSLVLIAFAVFILSNNTLASKSQDFVIFVGIVMGMEGWLACRPALRRREAILNAALHRPLRFRREIRDWETEPAGSGMEGVNR